MVHESVSEFVGHYGFLFFGGNPVGDVEFFALGVVEAGDLIGQHVEKEFIQRKILGDQPESFESFLIGVLLARFFVLFVLANQVLANFGFGAKALLERGLDGEIEEVTHLVQNFIGGL